MMETMIRANHHGARIIGRKRVLSQTPEQSPSKRKFCSSPDSSSENERNLDRLPEQLLVRILSKARHRDLRNLLLVSKTFRDATVVAKKLHFNYYTPPPEIRFRGLLRHLFEDGRHDHDDHDGDETPEFPTTPKRDCRRKDLSPVIRYLARDLLAEFDSEDH